MRLCLCMALWTLNKYTQHTYVEELATAGCTDSDLGIQDVFARGMSNLSDVPHPLLPTQKTPKRYARGVV